MKFTNPYWSNKLRISALQRWILVHSIIYYELNTSIIEDKLFDANSRQLVQMQNDFPEDAIESDYYYVFYNFDGNTGFDLYERLNNKDKKYLTHIAKYLITLGKGGR